MANEITKGQALKELARRELVRRQTGGPKTYEGAEGIAMNVESSSFEAPEPPPGMVLDPKTGQMVDTAAIAERQNDGVLGTLGTVGATAVSGIPFVGTYLDELAGGGDPVRTEVARQRMGQFSEENPKTALGLQVAGGLSAAIPAAIAAAPLVAGAAPATLGGQAAAGAASGIALGAAEGAVSGYGRGTDGDSREREALEGGLIGGGLGGAAGLAAPYIAAGAKPIANKVLDAVSLSKRAKASGLSKPSRDILTRAMDADGSFDGQGLQNIRNAGSDSMLADSGPNAKTILDTAIQRSGKAGNIARRAVEERAANANTQINQALDDVLGQPQGISGSAKNIALKSRAARQAAYDAAYEKPIDYAGEAGRKIEEVFSRIPDRIKKTAIQRANEAMVADGKRNMQLFADIAEDGTVTSKQPPNVQQLDYVKRELGNMGAEAVDQFGRRTGEGNMVTKLSRELRDSLGEAVPEYKVAVQLGGDKIAEDNALDLGRRLLSSTTTREEVADAAGSMTGAQKRMVMTGVRSQFDEKLAQVSRTVTDGNMDAREAIKALKDLSSRANREKLKAVVGNIEANRLFNELDKAAASLDLRASVAGNSKTYARSSMDQIIQDASEPGIIGTLLDGEPINAVKKLAKATVGRSDAVRRELTDQTYEELAKALTQARGGDAEAALQNLAAIAAKSPENARVARALAAQLGLSLSQLTYQTGTRWAAGQ